MKSGSCGAIAELMQGDDVAVCQEAVFWIEHAPAGSHESSKVIAYLEGNVGVHLIRNHQPAGNPRPEMVWLLHHDPRRAGQRRHRGRQTRRAAGHLSTRHGRRNPESADALRQTGVDQAQYVAAQRASAARREAVARHGVRAAGNSAPLSHGTRRVRVFARGRRPHARPVGTRSANASGGSRHQPGRDGWSSTA